MQNNLLEYVDNIVSTCPGKIAYSDGTDGLTHLDIYNISRSVGSFLLSKDLNREPVVVFMGRKPLTVAAFFGVIRSGCFYVPLDSEMPRHRIELIFESLKPRAVIFDEDTEEAVKSLDYQGKAYLIDDIKDYPADETNLNFIRDISLDTDPVYVVFTSGSTGTPKGVVACHRSVIDYVENLSEVLQINDETVFGSQAPLYVDACLKELFPTFKFGAQTVLVPKELFMFPVRLVEFLNTHKINTVCWVASALSLVSGFKTFNTVTPEHLKTIAFGSEVFPVKQLNEWRRVLPDSQFINLYGPTEATGMSCYYKVEREFETDEVIPIGRPFKNTEILLINDGKRITAPDIASEICIRGTALTHGYYNNPEMTAKAFVQNPLNTSFDEKIYLTGDLAKYNTAGELIYISRKDYQVKHMGHRIELGEIESAVNTMDGIKSACCIFDDIKKKIVLYYSAEHEPAALIGYLKQKLPRYMLPGVVNRLDTMPLTSNGKIDRKYLKEMYEVKK